MKRTTSLAITATLVTLAALPACGAHPYYGTASLSQQAGDPTAQIDPNYGIRMTEGSAASAHIDLESQTGGTLTGDIRSQNPDVLEILHAPHDGSTYVFLAKKVGLAEVFVITDGVPVRSIDAIVHPPTEADGAPFPDVDSGTDAGDAGEETDAGDAGESADAGADAKSDAADGGGASDAGDGSD